MSDIISFLIARIVEDEMLALKQADDSDHRVESGYGWATTYREGTVLAVDPARVLAECEAKARIMEEHTIDGNEGDPICRHLADEPCDTLRSLAGVYAHHPDYRGEWRHAD